MKEEINLLAPLAKAERLHRLIGNSLNYIWRRLVMVCCVLLVLLSVAYGVFTLNARLFQASLVKNENQDAATQQAVSSTNELLKRFQTFIKDSRTWSPDVVEVLKVMPVDVQLSSITARQSDGALLLEGVTQNRNAVIDFQRQLEKITWVDHVEAPLKNFATDTSGEFTFTIFFKGEKKI